MYLGAFVKWWCTLNNEIEHDTSVSIFPSKHLVLDLYWLSGRIRFIFSCTHQINRLNTFSSFNSICVRAAVSLNSAGTAAKQVSDCSGCINHDSAVCVCVCVCVCVWSFMQYDYLFWGKINAVINVDQNALSKYTGGGENTVGEATFCSFLHRSHKSLLPTE